MKNAKWIIVGIGLIVLLAGGAYFGAQAVAKRGDGGKTAVSIPALNTNDGLSGVMAGDESGGMPESGMSEMSIEIENSPELPDREPETAGFVLEREDDTFLIGTGEPKINVTMNDDGTPNISIDGTEGPSVEVVITHDTQVYEDVSDPTAMFSGESSSFQQEVKLVNSVDDLATDNATMMVWGTKRGERIIADVVVIVPSFSVSEPFEQ